VDGHSTGLSYLDLSVRGQEVEASLDLPARDLAQPLRLSAADKPVDAVTIRAQEAILLQWLARALLVSSDSGPCEARGGSASLQDDTLLTIKQTYVCHGTVGRLSIESHVGETVGSGYSTFVQLRRPDGRADRTLLTGDQIEHTFLLDTGESAWRTASEFVRLGMHHIFTGYDHILFLLCLLMLGGTLGRIVGLATAFTAAHTITLSLAATHTVALPSRLTETAIAVSIAYVAVENWFYARRPAPGRQEPLGLRLRWLLTFGFGLVHGFGFASALAERGLPQAHLPLALASFNAGVEIGQIIIIAGAWPLLRQADRLSWYRPTAVRSASSGIFCIALYWAVQRATGS
jgi:hypothetical protein